MTTTNRSQASTLGLPPTLRRAQAAIRLPEVQAMLQKLSEYDLGPMGRGLRAVWEMQWKTSVIEVRDLLSVLNAQQIEKRVGGVPGVASVTVNDAAGKATVRYDEARVALAAIKASVHRRGQPSTSRSMPNHLKMIL